MKGFSASVVLLETSETATHLKDSPGSFLQLVMVFRVKRQLHCFTCAVVVHDGLVQLDPQDGLRANASWGGPVLTSTIWSREHQNQCALIPTIMFKLKTVVIHRLLQQVDGPPQKTLGARAKDKDWALWLPVTTC